MKYFRKYTINSKFFKNIQIFKYKLTNTRRGFCESINLEPEMQFLSNKPFPEELKIAKLSKNILKYLENNQVIYNRLCNESVQLSYEIGNNASDIIKNELIRVNKQINSFQRDTYYYEQFNNTLKEMLSTNELLKEAIEIGEEELKTTAEKDLENYRIKLEEMQTEIIEYLIPEDEVCLLILLI